jgi:N-acylneuraminate cytidylyltransferase
VAARGDSKGIPRKNLIDFCGKPLIAWTIEQALAASGLGSVWVSSDDDEILEVAASYGARQIRRPQPLATGSASSEAAWSHAIDRIEDTTHKIDLVCALQATSPVREPSDLDRGLEDFARQGCDSLFSASPLEDFLIWECASDGTMRALNYDPAERGQRQGRSGQYVENGSFYLFRPVLLRSTGNRMGGRIGISIMEFWKAFEVDDEQGLEMCSALMRKFGLA